MPRRPRVFVEGGIYHVYNRFARGAEVFKEGDEADRFLELLRKAAPPLVDADQTLSLFGGTTRTARRRYVRQLEGVRDVEWRTELPGWLPWWTVSVPGTPEDVSFSLSGPVSGVPGTVGDVPVRSWPFRFQRCLAPSQ